MFKNKKFEVKVLDDKQPKYNRITEGKSDDDTLAPRPPMDRLDIELLSQEIAQDVVTAYLLIKATKTICSVVEHIVVTRVK